MIEKITNNFPTYKKKLSSFERACYAREKMNIYPGWGFANSNPAEFDENFNHRRYDNLQVPRIIDVPISFEI